MELGSGEDLQRGIELVARLPDVTPQQADEGVRLICEDARTALRVPFVHLIFRKLANYPTYLSFAWDRLSPYLRTLSLERAADGAPAGRGEAHLAETAAKGGIAMSQPLTIYETMKRRAPDIDTPNFRGWLVGEDSQARVLFWEITGRAPTHIHNDSTHYLTVLSGRLLGAIEGEEYEAHPGTLVIMPRGKRHTHRAPEGEVCLAIDTAVPPLAWDKTVWVES